MSVLNFFRALISHSVYELTYLLAGRNLMQQPNSMSMTLICLSDNDFCFSGEIKHL